MSVADVSGKAIANLATEELSHPAPVFHGDTLFAESEVLDVRPSQSKGDRGVVKVHTRVHKQDGTLVAEFKRAVLVPTARPGIAQELAAGRVLLKILYWVAVVAISLALVVALILFFESRDQSSVESDSALPALAHLTVGLLAPHLAGVHDDPLRRAVERMAGAQHQAAVADRLQHGEVLVVDDLGLLDAVDEAPVGHVDDDPVARVELVDVAERRAVGGAVAGDRRRPALAGQRRLGVVAGPLAEALEIGALDDVLVHADRRNLDPRDRIALQGLSPDDPLRRVDEGGLQLLLVLVRDVGGDRLLPQQGDRGVGDEERPADHHHRGHKTQHRTHGQQCREGRIYPYRPRIPHTRRP